MASKPRKLIDPAMDDRTRGSVFDRLGAKQQQQYHQQIRSSSSNKMQSSSKYDSSIDYPKTDSRRKVENPSYHHSSSHNRHLSSGNQFIGQDTQQIYRERASSNKHVIKSKINKEDQQHYDQFKK